MSVRPNFDWSWKTPVCTIRYFLDVIVKGLGTSIDKLSRKFWLGYSIYTPTNLRSDARYRCYILQTWQVFPVSRRWLKVFSLNLRKGPNWMRGLLANESLRTPAKITRLWFWIWKPWPEKLESQPLSHCRLAPPNVARLQSWGLRMFQFHNDIMRFFRIYYIKISEDKKKYFASSTSTDH